MLKKLIFVSCFGSLCACGGGGGSTPAATFSMSSSSYTNNGVLPQINACSALGGSDVSPQLTLTNLPANAAKFAIVMDDEDSPCGAAANACVHWAVFNLPSSKTSISAGEALSTISNVTYGQTYDGLSNGYAGACPPPSNHHTYKLTVFALDAGTAYIPQGVNFTRSTFASNFASRIVGSATWTGTYSN